MFLLIFRPSGKEAVRLDGITAAGSWKVTEGQADPGNKKETTKKKKRSLIGLGVSGMSIGQRRRRLWLVEVLPNLLPHLELPQIQRD